MEVVAAVGVAAAAVAFFDISLKALAACKQFREDGALSSNISMEKMAKELEVLTKDLKFPGTPSDTVETQIQGLSLECCSLAKDLQSLLNEVKLRSNGRLEEMKAFLKNAKAKGTIKELESKMFRCQKLVDSAFLSSIHKRLRDMNSEQMKAFESLNTATQEVVKHMANDMQLVINQISNNQESLEKQIRESQAMVSQEIQSESKIIQTNLENMENSRNEDARRTAVLESLFFPDIKARQETVPGASKSTFEWIFDENKTALGSWNNFVNWLRNENGLYWIHGKPGAGKSTLMSFIFDHSQTKNELRHWTQGEDPICLAFFFWRPGTKLQRSTLGMLRSLLHQLLEHDPDVLEAFGSSTTSIPTWNEKVTKSTFLKCLQVTKKKICIFIDGLDEFEDDNAEDEYPTELLLDMCKKCAGIQNVKLCVSSRPERGLRRAFESCRQLRLQDLTHKDMEQYVGEVLPFDGLDRIRANIVERAEGIFLWTSLVTKSIRTGYLNKDDEETLKKRLNKFPKGLESLYSHMLLSIDDLYTEKAKCYILMVHLTTRKVEPMQRFSICTLALSTNPKFTSIMRNNWSHVVDSSELVEGCQDTEDFIQTYCRGFLEVSDGPSSHVPDTSNQERVLNSDMCLVKFAHRTAYDFIFDSEPGKKFMAGALDAEPDLEIKLLEGLGRGFFVISELGYWNIRYQERGFAGAILSASCVQFSHMARDKFLDNLYRQICSVGDRADFSDLLSLWGKDIESDNPMYGFLKECVEFAQLHGYVSSCLPAVPPEPLPDSILLHTLILNTGRAMYINEGAIILQSQLLNRLEVEIPFDTTLQLGCHRCDFYSLGSDDLNQGFTSSIVDYAAAGKSSLIGIKIARTMNYIAEACALYRIWLATLLARHFPYAEMLDKAFVVKTLDFSCRIRQLATDGYGFTRTVYLTRGPRLDKCVLTFSTEIILSRLLYELDLPAILPEINSPLPSPWALFIESSTRGRERSAFQYNLSSTESKDIEIFLFENISIEHSSTEIELPIESFVSVLLKVLNSTAAVRERLQQLVKEVESYNVTGESLGYVGLERQTLAVIKRIRDEKRRMPPTQPLLSNEQDPQDESDPGMRHDISSGTTKSVNVLFTFCFLLPLLLTLLVKWAYNSWLSWFKQ